MTDLTIEEFDEMVEMAVDDALNRAFENKVTAPGLMIMLKKYGVANDKGRTAAFKMMKDMGMKVYSNEGFPSSGRLK